MVRNRRVLTTAALAPLLVLALAACGGGSSSATSAGAGQATSGANGYGGRGNGGGFQNNGQFQKIQECLSAAGISLPTPSARPSGSAGARSSNMPSFSPGATPSGGFRGGNGGGGFGGNSEMGKVLQSKAAQAALKACGIDMTARPTAAPTASS